MFLGLKKDCRKSWLYTTVFLTLSPSMGLSQSVDHDKILTLFEVLGVEVDVEEAVSDFAAVNSEQYSQTTAPVAFGYNDASPPQTAGLSGVSGNVPSVPFSNVVPDGSNCPADPKEFEEALRAILDSVMSYENVVIEMSARYDLLDDENIAFLTSDSASCPTAMRQKYNSFLSEIIFANIADDILPAENLQFCAQTVATRLDGQIKSISEDASMEDQTRRMALSRVMRAVASLDETATDVVQRMISLEQKRQRLVSGVNQFDQQCIALESVNFSADYK